MTKSTKSSKQKPSYYPFRRAEYPSETNTKEEKQKTDTNNAIIRGLVSTMLKPFKGYSTILDNAINSVVDKTQKTEKKDASKPESIPKQPRTESQTPSSKGKKGGEFSHKKKYQMLQKMQRESKNPEPTYISFDDIDYSPILGAAEKRDEFELKSADQKNIPNERIFNPYFPTIRRKTGSFPLRTMVRQTLPSDILSDDKTNPELSSMQSQTSKGMFKRNAFAPIRKKTGSSPLRTMVRKTLPSDILSDNKTNPQLSSMQSQTSSGVSVLTTSESSSRASKDQMTKNIIQADNKFANSDIIEKESPVSTQRTKFLDATIAEPSSNISKKLNSPTHSIAGSDNQSATLTNSFVGPIDSPTFLLSTNQEKPPSSSIKEYPSRADLPTQLHDDNAGSISLDIAKEVFSSETNSYEDKEELKIFTPEEASKMKLSNDEIILIREEKNCAEKNKHLYDHLKAGSVSALKKVDACFKKVKQESYWQNKRSIETQGSNKNRERDNSNTRDL